jgi:hypothetical protein
MLLEVSGITEVQRSMLTPAPNRYFTKSTDTPLQFL